MNVLGVVFMDSLPSPFEAVEKILTRESGNFDVSILDTHAEATSEKLAIGKYFDGRIDLIFGTHTHVRTDDAKILPGGSAYITDVGMSGPVDGILGTDATAVITKFLTHMPSHFTVAQGDSLANGIIFEYDTNQKRALNIRPIDF
jgi:calcineurin-like phosphoesterase